MPLGFKDFMVAYDPKRDEYLQYRAQKRRRNLTGGTIGGPVGEQVELEEALDMAQRRKASLRMRKFKSRLKVGRERAARRTANMSVLKRRARKHARNMLVRRFTQNVPKGDLDFARRQSIEKRVDKMKGAIDRIAKKMIPQLRKSEITRKSKRK